MLRCNILSIFLAFSLLAGAQDWKVVRENPQKAFPKTVAAGNYSGIAHLHDDIYAVVSDKSDSALYFNFRIQVNPKTGELEQVENLGFTERTDGTLNDAKPWQGLEKGFDHEAIVKLFFQRTNGRHCCPAWHAPRVPEIDEQKQGGCILE